MGMLLLVPVLAITCAYVGKTRLRVACCREHEVFDTATHEYRPACAEDLPQARVLIDGVDVGSCGVVEDGIYVEPGSHQVTVQMPPQRVHRCCFSETYDVEIPRSGDVKRTAYLQRFPH
jgi:hypothetical protein